MKTANRLNTVSEYFFSHKLREIEALNKEGKNIINIAIGSPDLQPPKEVVEALKESFQIPTVHKYQSYSGVLALREAMATFYKKQFGVTLNPQSEILPLMGSKEGIFHISMAYLNKGDEVLIPNPGYPTYASVTKLLEAKPRYYNLSEKNKWQPDFEEIEKEELTKVKLMWVNYPHMPSGADATKQDFEKLVAFAKKHEILLINDNPYAFILNDNPLSLLSVDGSKEVALELNSLSKTFHMAGWRVGMVLGDEAKIQNLLKVKSNMDSGMFLGIQLGAIKALTMDKNWINEQQEKYRIRRNLVWRLFDKLDCTYHKESKGLFVFAKMKDRRNSIDFSNELLYKNGVFITPGSIFGSNGEGYLRASLCVPESLLEQAINRL